MAARHATALWGKPWVSIRDNALSATLQTDAALTLETAKLKICQREAVHEQQRELKGAENGRPGNVDNVHSRRRPNYSDKRVESSRQRETGSGARRGKQRDKQCSRCGKGQHPRDKCPAREATCHSCQEERALQLTVSFQVSRSTHLRVPGQPEHRIPRCSLYLAESSMVCRHPVQ